MNVDVFADGMKADHDRRDLGLRQVSAASNADTTLEYVLPACPRSNMANYTALSPSMAWVPSLRGRGSIGRNQKMEEG